MDKKQKILNNNFLRTANILISKNNAFILFVKILEDYKILFHLFLILLLKL